ncbi:MAG: cysteine desulfurase family protein [Clostridia bacterium]
MKVYLDNAATTKLDKCVLDEMIPYLTDVYGNASSIHSFGREAQEAVDNARMKIAKLLGATDSEIYFTSGGTESDNWVLNGIAKNYKNKGKHIITTKIEHPAMLNTCAKLEKEGYSITYLDVNKEGIIELSSLENAVREDTILVSVMFANNEIGSIQPIEKIGAFCKEKGILFHTDAVQAATSIRIDLNKFNIDMLSMSAHKFNGPKGVGLLYIRNGINIASFINGGHQERNYRAGTTNTPAIVGMAKALEITYKNMEENNKKILKLRDYFVDKILENIPDCKINGSKNNRLLGNVNIGFDYVKGESMVIALDLKGIAVSSGSACVAGSSEPSYVIAALGGKKEDSENSVRFSIGKDNTIEEIDYTIEVLIKLVSKMREVSSLFKIIKGGTLEV